MVCSKRALPLYLRSVYSWDRHIFGATKSLLTIHNLGYQGVFGAELAPSLLPPEFHSLLDASDLDQGRINLLKTGITHADRLTTVSPTYAREIQTPDFGAGLDSLLRSRAEVLVGFSGSEVVAPG